MSCGITPELGRYFVGGQDNERQLDLILHFEHVELDCVDGDKWVLRDWKLSELKAAVSKWQTCMAEAGGWDTIWIENHDQPRGVSRFAKEPEMRRQHAAKLLAMWMFTLQGTVIMFQGQELGMTNPDEFSEDMVRDIETRLYWNEANRDLGESGEGAQKLEMAKKAITSKGRDGSRIPIPVSTTLSRLGVVAAVVAVAVVVVVVVIAALADDKCFGWVSGMATGRRLAASPTLGSGRGCLYTQTSTRYAPKLSGGIRHRFGCITAR